MSIEKILDKLENVKMNAGGNYSARCPAHDDRHNSLSVSVGKDGRTLICCHAGCPTEKILNAVGLAAKDLFPDSEQNSGNLKKETAEAEYVYASADGRTYLKKTRLRKPDGSKIFFWEHLEGEKWVKGRGGFVPGIYNGDAMASDRQIFVVEGEKDADNLSKMGFTAVSLADGADSRWKDEYTPAFCEKEVYILPDHDEPGRKYARMIAEKIYGTASLVKILVLSEKWAEIPPKADVSDMLESFGEEKTALAISDLAQHTEEWKPDCSADSRFQVMRASDFGEDNTRFLWYPYIPIGEYTVLMAEGGTGKTTLCCGIAAAVSNGIPLPGDNFPDLEGPGKVLMITAEDRGELLRKRLAASGANLDKVLILDCMRSSGLDFSCGLHDLEEILVRQRPSVVFVDPWHAFIGSELNINCVNALRPVLQEISIMAKKYELAIVLISHINKKSQTENINNAATGSTDFINASRSALRLIFDGGEDHENRRIIVHSKSNYARAGQSVRFLITENSGLEWDGFSEIRSVDLAEASRRGVSPERFASDRKEMAERRAELVNAVAKEAVEGETVNISYSDFKELYGDDIFVRPKPKAGLDEVYEDLKKIGITIATGKHVKSQGKSVNGFSITKARQQNEAISA